jgi:hypothetical protein
MKGPAAEARITAAMKAAKTIKNSVTMHPQQHGHPHGASTFFVSPLRSTARQPGYCTRPRGATPALAVSVDGRPLWFRR